MSEPVTEPCKSPHPCTGGCGTTIDGRESCCGICWWRCEESTRRLFGSSWLIPDVHAEALRAMLRDFEKHPVRSQDPITRA